MTTWLQRLRKKAAAPSRGRTARVGTQSREGNQRLTDLHDPLPTVIVSVTGEILSANRSALLLFGGEREDLLGRQFSRYVVDRRDSEMFVDDIAVRVFEALVRTPEDVRRVTLRMTRRSNGPNCPFSFHVVLMLDLTEAQLAAPAADTPVPVAIGVPEAPIALAPRLPLVFVVDDQSDMRELCKVFLSGSGFVVEQARDGQEALIKAARTTPDAVITDIAMPGMDGFALCRAMKRDDRLRHVPVIALTACEPARHGESSGFAGFDSVLIKPCHPDVLLHRLREAVARTADGARDGAGAVANTSSD